MSVLDHILAYKCEHVARRKAARTLSELEREIASIERPRRFLEALKRTFPRTALIAEIKKASPSKGVIRHDFDPETLAGAYRGGGATCLSVPTDAPSFQGADEYLRVVRRGVALPVLRKDFIVDPWQVAESRALGADAILLIMAIACDDLAREVLAEASRFDLDVLVETHTEDEVERALGLGAAMIGINNRSLQSFETDLSTKERLARLVPSSRIVAAESGITSHDDIARLGHAGADAFLVGESLIRQEDVAAATRTLLA